jgi:hypothetical protein
VSSPYIDADEARVYEPYHGQAGWKPPYEHAQWQRWRDQNPERASKGYGPTERQWKAAKYPRINWGMVIAVGFLIVVFTAPLWSR